MIDKLKTSHAISENGQKLYPNHDLFLNDYLIFKTDNNISIEDPESNFNQQRLSVIRYTIERNLSIAIANYNNYTGVKTEFLMPTLKEDEWEKILNNVSIISFLQGLSIGGKIYNGYSIITNNKNKETVSEESIYIVSGDNQYHRPNDSDLIGNGNIRQGILNIDFERRSVILEGVTKYFFPNSQLGCYNSVVTQANVDTIENYYKYMKEMADNRFLLFSTSLLYSIGKRTIWFI